MLLRRRGYGGSDHPVVRLRYEFHLSVPVTLYNTGVEWRDRTPSNGDRVQIGTGPHPVLIKVDPATTGSQGVFASSSRWVQMTPFLSIATTATMS